MSCSLFGRFTHEVINSYINVLNKKASHSELVEKLESNAYQQLQNLKDWTIYPDKNKINRRTIFPLLV